MYLKHMSKGMLKKYFGKRENPPYKYYLIMYLIFKAIFGVINTLILSIIQGQRLIMAKDSQHFTYRGEKK